MAWTPTASDSQHAFRGYEFAFYVTLDDGFGQLAVLLLYRAIGAPAWTGGGAVFQGVQQQWVDDVKLNGGFQAWITAQLIKANALLATLCAQLFPPSAPGGTDPATWPQFQAWALANVVWIDAADSVTITKK